MQPCSDEPRQDQPSDKQYCSDPVFQFAVHGNSLMGSKQRECNSEVDGSGPRPVDKFFRAGGRTLESSFMLSPTALKSRFLLKTSCEDMPSRNFMVIWGVPSSARKTAHMPPLPIYADIRRVGKECRS